MNEAAARNLLLVRAVETSGADSVWSKADAEWASRAATEVVGAGAPAERFLARRAALAVERLGERERSVARSLRVVTWRPWIGSVVVALALLLGVATDYIGPARRVNILAFPLLGLLAWNLLVYLFIVLRPIFALLRSKPRAAGPLARLIARLGRASPDAGDSLRAVAWRIAFAREWALASGPLIGARVARILHLGALAFAIGAVATLYLRGLVFDYQAGWESTFLSADQVQRLLALVLGPASALSGIALADTAHLEAIRFPASPGENAAPWLHLYALSIALVVFLPRAVLMLVAWFSQHRLERRFPLSLDEAYFQRLLRGFTGEIARVCVLPYACQLVAQSALRLRDIVTRVFGPRAELTIAASVAFGEEDALPQDLLPDGPLALALAFFSLSATPEAENHGSFLSALATRLGRGTPLLALIDEAGFRQRFAGQPARLEERRQAWRDVLAAQGVTPLVLDLAQGDVAAAAQELEAVLGQPENAS